jgi:hypothetical protein
MAGETPDYGALSSQATVFPVTDLGELAARLGSPITHDRRGDVVWWDDFECGLTKWGSALSGTGAAAALSTARARNGRSSALLTAGSDAGASALIAHNQTIPRLSRLGFEFSFSLGGAIASLSWELLLFDGTTTLSAIITWGDAANALTYRNSGGGGTVFATGVDLLAEATMFHTGKVVVDRAAGQYVRFVLDSTEYDLSGIAALTGASVVAPRLTVDVALLGNAGSNNTVYVDDVILTQNEPA